MVAIWRWSLAPVGLQSMKDSMQTLIILRSSLSSSVNVIFVDKFAVLEENVLKVGFLAKKIELCKKRRNQHVSKQNFFSAFVVKKATDKCTQLGG